MITIGTKMINDCIVFLEKEWIEVWVPKPLECVARMYVLLRSQDVSLVSATRRPHRKFSPGQLGDGPTSPLPRGANDVVHTDGQRAPTQRADFPAVLSEKSFLRNESISCHSGGSAERQR